MKPRSGAVIVAAIAACGSHEDRREKAGSAQPETRHSIDVTTSDRAYAIRGVEPAWPRGELQVGYRADTKAAPVVAEIKCRAGGYNLVYPAVGSGSAGTRQTAVFRPAPFDAFDEPCEVAFYAGIGGTQIAAACVKAGTISDGVCPQGSFPAPPRQSRNDVELAKASLELRESTAVFTSLWTVAVPLEADRHFVGQVRCTDEQGTLVGEAPAAFLSLERMPAGTSVYGPLVIPLERTPAPTARCQLRILSRPARPPLDELTHGTYCATPSGILVGPCG
ncbi:MAG: hypothetical protein HOV81_00465 [Kofleriaceae bacterium]|nr:hypothetical protein [Kofleriaceae bacterium]